MPGSLDGEGEPSVQGRRKVKVDATRDLIDAGMERVRQGRINGVGVQTIQVRGNNWRAIKVTNIKVRRKGGFSFGRKVDSVGDLGGGLYVDIAEFNDEGKPIVERSLGLPRDVSLVTVKNIPPSVSGLSASALTELARNISEGVRLRGDVVGDAVFKLRESKRSR